MKINDEVCYSQEFLQQIGGYDPDIANRTGQIVEFKYGGKFASVEWDDGGTSTAKLSNLRKTKEKVPSTGDEYQRNLMQERAEIMLKLGAEFYPKRVYGEPAI